MEFHRARVVVIFPGRMYSMTRNRQVFAYLLADMCTEAPPYILNSAATPVMEFLIRTASYAAISLDSG